MINKFKRNRILVLITIIVISILTVVLGNQPIIAFEVN
jgi:hypothetical protein